MVIESQLFGYVMLALLVALVLLQYLGFVGVLALPAFLQSDPQLVLAEGTAVGFILVTVVHNRRR